MTPPAATARALTEACRGLRASGAGSDARRPFYLDAHRVGSLTRAACDALASWPDEIAIGADAVRLRVPPAERDAALARINLDLRRRGLVQGWRDERVAVPDLVDGAALCAIERACARWWGTRTHGAHANGFVCGADGRPTHLWIARRAATKSTDPGLLDNLVGGGVALGQSPLQALIREGREEAGLLPRQFEGVRAAGVLRVRRDTAFGLQREDLHAFDLPLPRGLRPLNQDGEVSEFHCLPIAEALALATSAAMTADAALVTLDFALRHRLLPPGDSAGLRRRILQLRRQAPG